ncbi:hypothetical protein GCM10017600_86840 [Streptosporangium carneum]|uniref:Uncharacterized protein n=1 Tax=Streptosporangium carneum TaxID=47481 RepID=A0A9W6IAV1_9ACTN|nr:hypothetical protein GCM10017600_86840 [Streptosporangium carneum]
MAVAVGLVGWATGRLPADGDARADEHTLAPRATETDPATIATPFRDLRLFCVAGVAVTSVRGLGVNIWRYRSSRNAALGRD